MARPLFPMLVIVLLAVSACSDPAPAPATSVAPNPVPTTTTMPLSTMMPSGESAAESTTTTSGPLLPPELEDFRVETIRLDGSEFLVAIADTGELRRQGLMLVADLADLDGMLFIFDQDTSSGFWMKDTIIDLVIAFFDADGRFVDGFAMEPCPTAECPTYRPSAEYRYALEVAAGAMPAGVDELRFGD